MPSPIGTPQQIVWEAGATPAPQNVTVPAGASAAYIWGAFDGVNSDTDGIATLTLGGSSYNKIFAIPTSTSFESAIWVAEFLSPPSGSQEVEATFTTAPVEGSVCAVCFVENGGSWDDADADHATEGNAVSVTLATDVDRLIIKFDQRYDPAENPPALSSGWTNLLTGGNNDEGFRLSYIVATGATQVCNSEDEAYSAVVAISIPDAAPMLALDAGAPIALTGTLGISGDIVITSAGPFELDQGAPIALQGTLGITGDLVIEADIPIEQVGSIALQGSMTISAAVEIHVHRWRVPTNAPQGTQVHVIVFSGSSPDYTIHVQGTATVDADGFADLPKDGGNPGDKAFALVHNFDDDVNTTSIYGGPCIATIVDLG